MTHSSRFFPSFGVRGALFVLGLGALSALAACEKTPPEPESKKESAPAPPPAASGAELHASTPSPPAAPKGDPLDGKFTLADATKDITGTGALIATIDTSEGALRCKLLEDKSPTTVANFVGLAQGTRPWKDASGQWVTRPAYDGTTFHRIIKGFMIQGGDFRGNGTGEPGYVIPDENKGAKHDRAGLLCMANRGPNTNGAQFFITDEAAAHLDVSYTIFGECSPVDTVHKIASVKVRGETPEQPVRITSVKIAREKPGAAGKGDKADKADKADKSDAGAKH